MNRALLLLGCCVASLWGSGVVWLEWNAALQEAQRSGKPVMLDVVRNGCHYCEDMEHAVFEDEANARYIGARFVSAKVNLSESAMPLDLRVPMTPSFYFFTPEGALIKMVPGSWNWEDFRSFLDDVAAAPDADATLQE